MEEVEVALKLFKTLGILELASPILSIIILFMLIKKYLFKGFGKFLQDTVKEYISTEKSRVEIMTKFEVKMEELCDKFKECVDTMAADRKTADVQSQAFLVILQHHTDMLKDLTSMVGRNQPQKIL